MVLEAVWSIRVIVICLGWFSHTPSSAASHASSPLFLTDSRQTQEQQPDPGGYCTPLHHPLPRPTCTHTQLANHIFLLPHSAAAAPAGPPPRESNPPCTPICTSDGNFSRSRAAMWITEPASHIRRPRNGGCTLYSRASVHLCYSRRGWVGRCGSGGVCSRTVVLLEG